jgi:putative transposase
MNAKICESRLYKQGSNWFLYLVVEQDVPEKSEYQNVIGIDMGIKHIATSVELASGKTIFYGKQLNRVRGHYFWLRKNLGKAKAIDTIKKIGERESRTTNDMLHKISREIVNQAIATDAAIVIGNLKHLRRNRIQQRRKRGARLLNSFPYSRLTQYIKYKAALEGIKVIEVSEAWTSQTCTECRNKGVRLTQGLFKCKHCHTEENADRNAAFNIAKRGLGYMSKLGVSMNMPRTPAMHSLSAMMSGEAIALAR